MKYLYETHAHTSEVSACAGSSAVEIVRYLKSNGYSGVCITDHFLNGNTIVSHDLPWNERVDLLCLGYENARAEGEKIGIQVFFGWEFPCGGGTDLLTYKLDKKWLLENPDVESWDPKKYCAKVHEAGGYIVHAHPFRDDDYIPCIKLYPKDVDCVEIINTARSCQVNSLAAQYAMNYSLKVCSGSDIHDTGAWDVLGGVATTRKVTDLADLISLIDSGDIELTANAVVKRD